LAAVEDAEVEVVLVELLPQAAITRHAAVAASKSISRDPRRRILMVGFTLLPFVVQVGNQPLLDPLALLLLLVVRTPESLMEVAVMTPLEPFTPWTTIVSPGLSELLETLTLFVSLVLEPSLTFTVLPELSVT
jgi:hypothetical protein